MLMKRACTIIPPELSVSLWTLDTDGRWATVCPPTYHWREADHSPLSALPSGFCDSREPISILREGTVQRTVTPEVLSLAFPT